MLSPRVENGVSLFIKKLNGGYAKYFNEKYKRIGALFAGKYKKISIENESHFIHLPYYIHCNPLDLTTYQWREREISDYRSALRSLASYRWSSHLDYLGKRNFPSVTNREFLLGFFGGTDEYRNAMENWLETMDTEKIKEIMLEN
jgi:putative transposase